MYDFSLWDGVSGGFNVSRVDLRSFTLHKVCIMRFFQPFTLKVFLKIIWGLKFVVTINFKLHNQTASFVGKLEKAHRWILNLVD